MYLEAFIALPEVQQRPELVEFIRRLIARERVSSTDLAFYFGAVIGMYLERRTL